MKNSIWKGKAKTDYFEIWEKPRGVKRKCFGELKKAELLEPLAFKDEVDESGIADNVEERDVAILSLWKYQAWFWRESTALFSEKNQTNGK